MEIKPAALAISIASSALLFITSAACLLLQPDLSVLAPLWQIILLVPAIITLGLAFSRKGISSGNLVLIAADSAFVMAIVLMISTGIFHSGDVIARPFGIGASFGYSFVLPVLVMAASILSLKDSINILYGYGQRAREELAFLAIRLSAIMALLILGGILFIIIYKGVGILNWEFLTQPHRRLGQAGGISTAIVGSLWMVLGAMILSAPLGVGAAIYLNEYSKNAEFKRLITIAVSCLNGVPSVVFGLFALAFLVAFFGVSLLSGSIVLGLINIPTIILTSQEALKSVPNSLREGSLALGATKWQTIRKVVLPSAMPGVLTGIIMGVAKASGETAPIMWVAVTFTATPVQMIYNIIPNVFQPVNNLDYHLLNLIYFLGAWDVEARAWGTALVLLLLVLGTNMLAILVRNHYRKKISW